MMWDFRTNERDRSRERPPPIAVPPPPFPLPQTIQTSYSDSYAMQPPRFPTNQQPYYPPTNYTSLEQYHPRSQYPSHPPVLTPGIHQSFFSPPAQMPYQYEIPQRASRSPNRSATPAQHSRSRERQRTHSMPQPQSPQAHRSHHHHHHHTSHSKPRSSSKDRHHSHTHTHSHSHSHVPSPNRPVSAQGHNTRPSHSATPIRPTSAQDHRRPHRSSSRPPKISVSSSQPLQVTHVQTQRPPRLSPSPNRTHTAPRPPLAIQSSSSFGLESQFQYSKCTGRKKALCIGINYRGQKNELRGCINDARHVRDYLIQNHGYRSGDIVILTDDSSQARKLPTKQNILDAMHWLVKGAQQHDSLFFHYSGHGGQTKDLDGDERDGFDEVIYPLDYIKRGHIVDDEMHDIMVRPLPTGCRLTALFDSCHSGTVLDLPYIYSSHGRLKGTHVSDRSRHRKRTPADVISWSGCQDGETSADTFADGVAVGAMSHAFIKSLTNNPNQTYQQLLKSIRLILQPRYKQKPQLGSSHHIDTSLRFII